MLPLEEPTLEVEMPQPRPATIISRKKRHARKKRDKQCRQVESLENSIHGRNDPQIAPIDILPHEIIAAIFLIVKETSQKRGFSESFEELVGVCKLWRAIAVGYTSLWCNIEIRPGKWTKLQLARSQSAPLTLRSSSLASYSRFISIFSDHVERVRECRLVVDHAEVLQDSFAPLMRRTPSILEAIEIAGEIEDGPVLFDFELPALRRLVTMNVPVFWSSPYLLNLTYLSIIGSSPSLNGSQLHRMLRFTPLLQFLNLTGSLPEYKEVFDGATSISLKHLRHLDLQSGFGLINCAHFITFLSFPPSVNIFVRNDKGVRSSLLKEMIHIFLSCAPLAEGSKIILDLSKTGMKEVILQKNDHSSHTRSVSLPWICASGPSGRSTFIGETFGSFAMLNSLKILMDFEGPYEIVDCLHWWTSLRKMPHISELQMKVDDGSLSAVINALSIGPICLLPSLRKLELERVWHRQRSSASCFIQSLFSVVEMRRSNGIGIQFLRLVGFGTPGPSGMVNLKEHVEDLQWEFTRS